MKAAFSSPGMMTIHLAFSKRSRGMALSGVAMISWKTRPAFSTRPMSSSRSEAKAGITTARLAIEIINTFLYMIFSPLVVLFLLLMSTWLPGDDQFGLVAFRGAGSNFLWVYMPARA